MQIIELVSENIKRVRVARIRPDGALVIIGGKNGAGKTSVIDSIEMLLGGNKTLPPDPVRHGAGSGRIFADLGDITVEKTISSKGVKLEVRDADGKKQTSPQKILDALCSKIAFDPLEFSRMDPKKQDEVLRQVIPGLDFTELDSDRTKLFDRRTEINRAVKQLQAKHDSLTHHPDAPAEEQDVNELMQELERRQEEEQRHKQLKQDVEGNQWDANGIRDEIEELEAMIASKRAAHEQALKDVETAKAALEAHTFDDPAEVKEQLASLGETNRKVRENQEREATRKKLDEARESSQKLTEALEGIEATKAERLAAAEFPVEGLSFGDAGPMLDGVPLEQASQAQRLRLSVAIGIALNPKLKVLLIRDGALLDEDHMRLVAEMAEQAGAQVWLERVGTGDPSAVIIEDGEVRETEVAAE